MKIKLILVAFATVFAISACMEKKDPASEKSAKEFKVIRDTTIALSAEDFAKSDYKLHLPFKFIPYKPSASDCTMYKYEEMKTYMMSDTASARTTPDFTDVGVGMLINNAAMTNPSLITSCIIPRLRDFFTSTDPEQTCAGPYAGNFTAPDPGVSIVEQCSSGVMVPWSVTGNQMVRWHATSSTVREAFLSTLADYEAAVRVQGYFQLIIDGLNYGGTVCTPYTWIAVTKSGTAPSGPWIYWRVRLNPPF